jgi:hypothetical protein
VQVPVMHAMLCCAILVLPNAVVHHFSFDVLLDTIIKDDLYVVLSSAVTVFVGLDDHMLIKCLLYSYTLVLYDVVAYI